MRRRLRQLTLATGLVQPRTEHAQLTLYPLPTPGAFPGEAGPCPLYRNVAVQSWLQHIQPAPSPVKMPDTLRLRAHGSHMPLCVWTSATCTAYHAHRFDLSHSVLFWAHTCKSFFASFWCALGQVLPLVLDRIAPCPINPSFSVLGSDQAFLCLKKKIGGGKERLHTRAAIATPPLRRLRPCLLLLPCRALFADRDGLSTAVSALGRFFAWHFSLHHVIRSKLDSLVQRIIDCTSYWFRKGSVCTYWHP